MESYGAVGVNNLQRHAVTRMDLTKTVLSKRGRIQRCTEKAEPIYNVRCLRQWASSWKQLISFLPWCWSSAYVHSEVTNIQTSDLLTFPTLWTGVRMHCLAPRDVFISLFLSFNTVCKGFLPTLLSSRSSPWSWHRYFCCHCTNQEVVLWVP